MVILVMAATIVYAHSMQTIGQPKGEAGSVGSLVTCSTIVGGPTARTTASIHLPPQKVGWKHWESKKFTIASLTPNLFLQVGFWVRFHNVDIADGDQNIPFFNFKRNGLIDLSLELATTLGGHELSLLDSTGSIRDISDLNPFNDNTWHWIELYFDPKVGGVFSVKMLGMNTLGGAGNFRNDASDLNPSILFEGQPEDTPDHSNTDVYIGPGYVAEDSLGTDDFIIIGARRFECITYRLGNTNTKCNESDVNGLGENPITDLTNTADDDPVTSSDYNGTLSSIIGSTRAFDVSPDDGPAPNWNQWTTVPFGMKYVWIMKGGTAAGTRTLRYGRHVLDSASWDTDSISVGRRNTFSEKFGLPGVGVFPTVPSKLEVAAMGWYIHFISGNTNKAIEIYFFVFCLVGDGDGNYLMLSKKVDSRTSLVGGGGRVG